METLRQISDIMERLPVHEQHVVRDCLRHHGPNRALELARRLAA